MYGVWYSIEETRKINNKNLVLQSIPLLKTSIEDRSYASTSYSKNDRGKTVESNDIGIFLRFNIENTTVFGAKDFEFEFYNISIYDSFEFVLYRGEHKETLKPKFNHDFASNLNSKIQNDIVLFQNNSFSIDIFFPYPLKDHHLSVAVIEAVLLYKYIGHNEPYKMKIDIDFTPEITEVGGRKSKYHSYDISIHPNISQHFIKNDNLFVDNKVS